MKTIKREAKVGERILITDRKLGSIQDGDTGLVTQTCDDFVNADIRGRIRPASHDEYEVIVEATDDMEARYAKLREDLTKAVEELRQLALDVRNGISEVRPTPPTAGEIAKVAQSTPQQQRDTIVEQAKKDIEDLKITLIDYKGYYVPSKLGGGKALCDVEFIENSEKRTVVALLRGIRANWVRAKGIAKCAPSDCFNSHIGKAIAVRRALGLEVPAEYLNAPQPTEVRVGDVIGYPFDPYDDAKDEVVSIKEGKAYVDGEGYYLICDLFISDDWEPDYDPRIIDDTRISEAEGVDGK